MIFMNHCHLGFYPSCRGDADSITSRHLFRLPPVATAPPHPTMLKNTTTCGSSSVDGGNKAAFLANPHATDVKDHQGPAQNHVAPPQGPNPPDPVRLPRAGPKMPRTTKNPKKPGLPQKTGPGTRPGNRPPGPLHRGQPSATQRRGKRRGHGHQRRDGPHRSGRCRRGPPGGGERSAGPQGARRRRPEKALLDCRRLGDHGRSGRPDRATDREASLWRSSRGSDQVGVAARPPPPAHAQPRVRKRKQFGYKDKAHDIDNGEGVDHDHKIGKGAQALAHPRPRPRRVARQANPDPAHLTPRGQREHGLRKPLSSLGAHSPPPRGKTSRFPGPFENRAQFQRLVKWRTGSEGRISCLKRDFGWNRTQIDGLEGAAPGWLRGPQTQPGQNDP